MPGRASAHRSPVYDLIDRVTGGRSGDFVLEYIPATQGEETFEIAQRGKRIAIRGTNDISLSVGFHWYLRRYAHELITWDRMRVTLPRTLSRVDSPLRQSTELTKRYYLNYCTYSYSMAFWDWARWEREVDWMALHGINMPLAAVGTDVVWRRVLMRLGYDEEAVGQFVASPAFQAWWMMNNLEGGAIARMDIPRAARAILAAMKRASKDATWVILRHGRRTPPRH